MPTAAEFFEARSVVWVLREQLEIANGGVPGRGVSAIGGFGGCFFARTSAIAREFLLEIDTSLAIAMSGLRTCFHSMEKVGFPFTKSEKAGFTFETNPGLQGLLSPRARPITNWEVLKRVGADRVGGILSLVLC